MSGIRRSVRLRKQSASVRIASIAAALFACGVASATPAPPAVQEVDLSELPIEQLLALEVFTASKFTQKVSDAPSAVSIVTAADIRAFGWRNLDDILRSMRGLYVSYDRNYSYLGARGFLRPGDYNSRFLLLVDGYRTNDSVYDQGTIGTEFVLDVDLIDRVEFVPGPGSSIYGSNAFFGVINVITKRGRDFNGGNVAVAAGSFGASKGRATYGWRDAGGLEVVLSASAFNTRGQDLYFPEFDTPATSNGKAQGLDYDRGNSVFAKFSYGPYSAMLAYSGRTKGMPTGSFSQAFNDPRSYTFDSQSFIDLGYRRVDGDAEWNAHAYVGRYDYLGDYPADRATDAINRDGAHAYWWGGEIRLTSTHVERHKLVAGIEFERDERRDQYNFNIDSANNTQMLLDDRRQGNRLGAYLQDEITLREDVLLNAGIRHDRNSSTGGVWNPRLALIWKPWRTTSLKALYGSAFRAPNAYEQYYSVYAEGGQKPNPDLQPERIRTRELVIEHHVSGESRITASLFHNTVSDLITQTLDPADNLLIYRNLSRAVTRGAEIEYERLWQSGAKLRTSYTLQRATDDASGLMLANSPRQVGKLNLSMPFIRNNWVTGIEAQYVGRRNTLAAETGAYCVANWSFYLVNVAQGLDVSASAYNLFDRRYADPVGEELVQDAIRQDGRNFRVKLIYRF
jgi:outer membrane receptor protein involved in Fe transport